MSTTFAFRDHADFHRAALHMAVAGGLAGLAVHVAAVLQPAVGPLYGPVPLAVVAGAAAFGATPPRRRLGVRSVALLLIGTTVAAFGLRLFGHVGPEPSLGAAVFAAAFAALVVQGGSGRARMPIALAAAAAAALCGRFVLATFAPLAALPSWLAACAAGASFGLVAALGLLPRHLERSATTASPAPGTAARTSSPASPRRRFAGRAMGVWARVESQLAEDAPVRKAIESSVIRLLDMANRWQAVEAGNGDAHGADALVARVEEIEKKIGRTDDPVARSQYERARAALAEQLRYVKEIGAARERVIARMHHYLAAMERLRFAVLNHRSADASRLAAEVQPILDDLESLGMDIDCASEAMGEVEKDAEREVAAPPVEPRTEPAPPDAPTAGSRLE